MRILFIIAMFLFIQSQTIFAAVGTNTDEGINYKMSYPIVYVNDQAVQDKINQDIYHYIAAFKHDFDDGKFYGGSLSYELKYEDDNYISLTLRDDRYNFGAAHGYYTIYGVVYDKKTGEKLPLSRFLNITFEDLNRIYPGHLFNAGDEEISSRYINDDYLRPEKITDNYYFLGNGGIALIYQVYELASYADGATTIRLNDSEVEYFNRKNRTR